MDLCCAMLYPYIPYLKQCNLDIYLSGSCHQTRNMLLIFSWKNVKEMRRSTVLLLFFLWVIPSDMKFINMISIKIWKSPCTPTCAVHTHFRVLISSQSLDDCLSWEPVQNCQTLLCWSTNKCEKHLWERLSGSFIVWGNSCVPSSCILF